MSKVRHCTVALRPHTATEREREREKEQLVETEILGSGGF